MRESLPRVEKRKERKGVTRRGTGTGIAIAREIGIGGEARTEIGKKTGIGRGTEIETVIVTIEIAAGIVVREGNEAEIGMMTTTTIIAAGIMIGNMSRLISLLTLLISFLYITLLCLLGLLMLFYFLQTEGL